MEDLDLASERSELERETILRRIMSRKPEGPQPCGECHFCSELVAGYKLFCDSDCADEWQRRRR